MRYTDGLSPWHSEGHRLMFALVRRISPTKIARRCAVKVSTITRLADGTRYEPRATLAWRLQKHFGVPVSAWDSSGLVGITLS